MGRLPLTRRYAYLVAAGDLGAAITGLILQVSHFRNPTYQPASSFVRHVLHLPGAPSTWWSWLFLVFAVGALLSVWRHHDQWTRRFFGAMTGWWLFWVVLYAIAWRNPTSGPWGPWLAAIAAIGNSRPVIAPSLSD